jgi:hypothetical protein
VRLGERGLVVGVVELELPAPAPVRQRDHQDRAHRVAVHRRVRCVELVVGDIDDQPLGRGGGPGHLDAGDLPDRAAPAVGPDQVLRAQPHGLAGAVLDIGRHPGGVLLVASEAGAEPELHRVAPGDLFPQCRLEQRLQEVVPARPAERADARLDVSHQPPPGGVVPDGGVLDDVFEQPADHPGRLVGAQRLVVDPHGARVLVDSRLGVDDNRAHAVYREQVRHRDAAGAGADDGDIGRHLAASAGRVRQERPPNSWQRVTLRATDRADT